MQFTDILLHWYADNKRSLPWRGERDVYRVWVSEIILQQTRIQQGWDYYLRFIEAFPNVKALAEADEEQVLRVWQGLGYYSRARNMHAAAQSVMRDHGGKFPTTYEQVRQLKGIGDYTAAAICAFAYGLPYPAVDGNVLRIISRVFGIHDNIADNSTRRDITALCQKLMKDADPSDFNQALMDFGSLQCTPKNPDCDHCQEMTPILHQMYTEHADDYNFEVFAVEVNDDYDRWKKFSDVHNLWDWINLSTSMGDQNIDFIEYFDIMTTPVLLLVDNSNYHTIIARQMSLSELQKFFEAESGLLKMKN